MKNANAIIRSKINAALRALGERGRLTELRDIGGGCFAVSIDNDYYGIFDISEDSFVLEEIY